jgi:hypothetical protein
MLISTSVSTSGVVADSSDSSVVDEDDDPQLFTNSNGADSVGIDSLSLDAWVGIACAAVILCCCCLTLCVVCAVRRKRRREAERNDALAYYQNSARPAPPSLSPFNAITTTSIPTRQQLLPPSQSTQQHMPTGIVAMRSLAIHAPPSTASWSNSSLPSLAQANTAASTFNRFPYSTAAPPGYESPTSALPNPYSSQASRYIDAAAPFQTMARGYELPPADLKGDF